MKRERGRRPRRKVCSSSPGKNTKNTSAIEVKTVFTFRLASK